MAEVGGKPGNSGAVGRISRIAGLVALVLVTAGWFFVNTRSPQNLCQLILPFAALSPILALVAIVLGGIARGERRGRAGLGTGSASLGMFLLFWMQMGVPPCGERFLTNRESAIGSMRTINTAEITYASAYHHGYSADLSVLGPGSGGPPAASAAGLIDDVLARGRKSSYTFTYAPGRLDTQGHIAAYTVVVRPISSGPDGRNPQPSFFTDETGVIRQTNEDRIPTAQDRPIGE